MSFDERAPSYDDDDNLRIVQVPLTPDGHQVSPPPTPPPLTRTRDFIEVDNSMRMLLWLPVGQPLEIGAEVNVHTLRDNATRARKIVDMNDTLLKLESVGWVPRKGPVALRMEDPPLEEPTVGASTLLSEAEYDPLLCKRVRPSLICCGVFLFSWQPLMLLWSWSKSSCDDGAPLYAYSPLVLYLVGIYAGERYFVRGLQKGNAFLHEAYLKVHRPLSTLGLDWAPIVVAMGKADAADFFTDGIQPGQVHACELEIDSFWGTYSESWQRWPVLNRAADAVGLSGFSVAVAFLAFLLQGARIMYCIFRTTNLALLEANVRTEVDNSESTIKLASAYEKIAEIAEQLGATLVAKLFTEAACAAALDGTKTMVSKLPEKDPIAFSQLTEDAVRRYLQHGEEYERVIWCKDIVWFLAEERLNAIRDDTVVRVTTIGILTRVVGEAAPSLLTALAFFALSFNHAGFDNQAKTTCSMVLSIILCLTKVKKCYDAWKITHSLSMLVVGMLIFVWVIDIAIKFVGVFCCDSRMFNTAGLYCVPGRRHHQISPRVTV